MIVLCMQEQNMISVKPGKPEETLYMEEEEEEEETNKTGKLL